MRSALSAAALVTLISGCSVYTQPSPDPTPVSPAPVSPAPTPTAQAPLYQIVAGAGATLQPGTQAGYAITANTGGAFRAVWTGDQAVSGTYHELQGTISTAGRITSVTPGCYDGSCPLAGGDVIGAVQSSAAGDSITFDTFATTGLTGLDFTVDTQPVYFDLYIDGVHQPQRVVFPSTAGESSVESIPFGLQL